MADREPIIRKFSYRPDIDGLRAVAVLAVLLYHADLGVSGGYVGVDVFFVISGYLITSLIVKDLEQGRFSVAEFYERRARRILPALVVIVLACLIAGWMLFFPADYSSLATTAALQAVFAANIYFWKTTGYFSTGVETKPLLHTWSLNVEEQFYLLMPAILMLAFRVLRLRSRRLLMLLFTTAILPSFLLSVYAVPRHPAAAFYLLPTRAWELLLGSALAVGAVPVLLRWMREAMAIVGLTGILVPCLLYTLETPFPGLAALPPCLGAALLIWGNSSKNGHAPTAGHRILS